MSSFIGIIAFSLSEVNIDVNKPSKDAKIMSSAAFIKTEHTTTKRFK